MKVHIVGVGKTKGDLGRLAAEYQRRAGRYWKLEVDEVRSGSPSATPDVVRRDEAERLLAKCGKASTVWLLTREGPAISSTDLAQKLAERALRSEQEIVILIGGAFGFDPGLQSRADAKISLSSLTLPHEMARVILLEQLYRAGTILRGEPYHKGPNS